METILNKESRAAIELMVADGIIAKDTAERYFPELKEGGDERTWIINYLSNRILNSTIIAEKENLKKAIAWVEKQGEQKAVEWHREDEQNLNACLGYIPDEFLRRWLMDVIHVKYDEPADKVEPKFRAGEWVVIDGEVLYIKEVTEDGYFTDEGGLIPFRNEKEVHIWTIQDAKDGDVLLSPSTPEGDKECPFIFKEIDKSGIVRFHIALIQSENIKIADGITNVIGYANAGYHTPATKEQRDTLMKAMADSGYEWDAEKKEMKKIEQNHANVFNIYEKSLLEKFKQAVYDCAWGKVTCKKEGETQEEYAERWAEQFLLMVRDWADDYIDFTIQQELRKSYNKGKENAVKENISAWSEDDEKVELKFNVGDIIRHKDTNETFEVSRIEIFDSDEIYYHLTNGGCICENSDNFERVEHKPDWSEEDEEMLGKCLDAASGYYSPEDKQSMKDWLNSIKERYTWKPSDEQMDAVKDAIDYLGCNTKKVREYLMSLYEQLKKLREE